MLSGREWPLSGGILDGGNRPEAGTRASLFSILILANSGRLDRPRRDDVGVWEKGVGGK